MTSLDLAAHGIRFEWQGNKLACFGPPDRPDLYEQVRAEVARRVAVMSAKIPAKHDYRTRTLCMLDEPPNVFGLCGSCGESLGATYRGGDCALCNAARYKTLLAIGWIAP